MLDNKEGCQRASPAEAKASSRASPDSCSLPCWLQAAFGLSDQSPANPSQKDGFMGCLRHLGLGFTS